MSYVQRLVNAQLTGDPLPAPGHAEFVEFETEALIDEMLVHRARISRLGVMHMTYHVYGTEVPVDLWLQLPEFGLVSQAEIEFVAAHWDETRCMRYAMCMLQYDYYIPRDEDHNRAIDKMVGMLRDVSSLRCVAYHVNTNRCYSKMYSLAFVERFVAAVRESQITMPVILAVCKINARLAVMMTRRLASVDVVFLRALSHRLRKARMLHLVHLLPRGWYNTEGVNTPPSREDYLDATYQAMSHLPDDGRFKGMRFVTDEELAYAMQRGLEFDYPTYTLPDDQWRTVMASGTLVPVTELLRVEPPRGCDVRVRDYELEYELEAGPVPEYVFRATAHMCAALMMESCPIAPCNRFSAARWWGDTRWGDLAGPADDPERVPVREALRRPLPSVLVDLVGQYV